MLPTPRQPSLKGPSFVSSPYESSLLSPARLRGIAHLYGWHTQPFETARLLEVGCGKGEALIPMALAYPHAEFVGICLDGAEHSQACTYLRSLELRNLRFVLLDSVH